MIADPPTPTLTCVAVHRMAFRFEPDVVRRLIPPGTPGCYVLSSGDTPMYVGRSDGCMQRRLAGHELLGRATHFQWQPCRDSTAAFHLEAVWYHHAMTLPGVRLVNAIHPAVPAGSAGRRCPFCGRKDEAAMSFALGRQLA